MGFRALRCNLQRRARKSAALRHRRGRESRIRARPASCSFKLCPLKTAEKNKHGKGGAMASTNTERHAVPAPSALHRRLSGRIDRDITFRPRRP